MLPAQYLPLTDSVAPADQAAVADVIRAAYSSDTPIYPIGGGTNLCYGACPTLRGMGLSLEKMAEVVDYPARDLTITVEAGITVAALAKRLAQQRQRLPIDVPRPDRATVGGVVATNTSGPRRYRWGTMRDYVIGIAAVDGRGTAFCGGGRVVKNVAGYNLCRLLSGSLGTLAVITQVTLMVKPTADASAMAVCDLSDLDVAERLLGELVHTKTLPAAIEMLLGPGFNDDRSLGPPSGSAIGRLVVAFEGSKAEVDWMLGQIRDEWRGSGMASPTPILGPQADRLWRHLAELPGSSAENAAAPLVQITVPPAAVVAVIRQLVQLDADCTIQAHGGNGVIRVRFSEEKAEGGRGKGEGEEGQTPSSPSQIANQNFAIALREQLRPIVTTAGGHMVVLSGPQGVGLNCRDVWGPAGDGAAVMQAIKDRFDPKGILNPGRFVYGNC